MRGVDDTQSARIDWALREQIVSLGGAFLEKDVLIAEVVPHICRIGRDQGARIVFYGGTSLSQAWGIIERMSEDADFRIMLPPEVSGQGKRRKYLS